MATRAGHQPPARRAVPRSASRRSTQRPHAQRRARDPPGRAGAGGPRSMPSARPGRFAGRCTASPCCSRTTSAPPTCRPPPGRSRSEGNIPERDAFLVERLRAEGAVILGKAELAEFANWMDPTDAQRLPSSPGRSCNSYNLAATPVARRRGSATVGCDGVRGRGDRIGDLRQHPLARRDPGPRRGQADGRPGQPRRRHPAGAELGHDRADGAQRHRRRDPARRDRRRRPARPCDGTKPRAPARRHGLPPVPANRRAGGRAAGRAEPQRR